MVLVDFNVGKSREEAFAIGAEIAKEVTRRNPWPVKLQFEKVYHPAVLVTKKRYAGFMYESPTQLTPDFDAKGIETVRRDGCLAGAKTLEKVCLAFFTPDYTPPFANVCLVLRHCAVRLEFGPVVRHFGSCSRLKT